VGKPAKSGRPAEKRVVPGARGQTGIGGDLAVCCACCIQDFSCVGIFNFFH
jgi:hypothetical protein